MSSLVELFEQVCRLGEPEKQAFLLDLRRRDPYLASELEQLLVEDARGGPLPSNPCTEDLLYDVVKQSSADTQLDPVTDAVLHALAGRAQAFARYSREEEVARGGMGILLKVWDGDIGREVAMKVVRATAGEGVGTPRGSLQQLARFLDEARINGRLEHPGIVPVHELGVDPNGRAYFTMQLVQGRELSRIFELAAAGQEGWTLTRALEVLLKVCDAMSYAHARGVVHRDLKPANVMVGLFGQVYVMDWGLARVSGAEARDIRPRPLESAAQESQVRLPTDTPVATMDGAILGTPWFMPPEQAAGRIEEVDARSDVYAVGAMLYHLLAGRIPYARPGEGAPPYVVLQRVLAGPPEALSTIAQDAPVELVAIAERAMARERSRRYADMGALSDDLRAFLDRRVVQAYEAGAWAEARKWVQRNRGLSSALGAALLLLVTGLTTSLVLKHRSDVYAAEANEQRGHATENAALAEERRLQAEENAKVAEQRRVDAEQSAAEARLQRATSDEVRAFLVGLFEAASPLEAEGRELTARDLLDVGRRRIDREFRDHPLARAKLLFTMGQSYDALGLYEAAEALLGEALELSTAQRGENDRETLEFALQLAGSLRDAGRNEEARTLLAELETRARTALGEDDELSLRIRGAVGGHLVQMGQYEEAARLLEGLLQRAREAVGEDAPVTLVMMEDLAYAYDGLGRLDSAAPLRRTAYEKHEALFGSDNPYTLIALHNLATLTLRQGKLEEAAELFQDCLERSSAVFPENHPYSLQTLNNMGQVYEAQGRLEEAATVYTECLDQFEKSMRKDHPLRFTLLHNLGGVRTRQSRFAEAEPLYLEALAGTRAQMGEDHPDVFTTLNDLGAVYSLLKRYPEAERYTREALEKRRAHLGASHPDTRLSMRNLSKILLQQGRTDEATALSNEELELSRAAKKP